MRVKVYKCYKCGNVQAPPAYLCGSCKSCNLEETEVSGEGVLYTYSTVHIPLASLESEAPYTIAIVDLEGGCRITGRLETTSSVKPLPPSYVLAKIRGYISSTYLSKDIR